MLRKFKIQPDIAPVGSWLLEDIYNADGTKVANWGEIITKELKSRLNNVDYINIAIDDGNTHNNNQNDPPKAFSIDAKLIRKLTGDIRHLFSDVTQEELVDLSNNITKDVFETVLKVGDDLGLSDLFSHDTDMYLHSLRVSIISGLFAMALKEPEETVQELILAGVLHDIGKTAISPEILSKPGRLTDEEFETMKSHTYLGWFKIKDEERLSEEVKLGILCHHEKLNGLGYPLGLTGNEIPYFAKIISIIDVFDALVSARAYKEGLAIHEAIRIMYDMCEKGDLDRALLNAFVSMLTLYPSGTMVTLTDGTKGLVLSQYLGYSHQPIIKAIETGQILDLTKDPKYKHLRVASVG